MIAADKVVTAQEVDYLNSLIMESGMEDDEPLRDKGKPVDLTIFDTRDTQVALAMELLILANTDKHYDVNELILWDDVIGKFPLTNIEREHVRANAEIAALLVKNVEELIDEAPVSGLTDEERRARADRRQNNRRGCRSRPALRLPPLRVSYSPACSKTLIVQANERLVRSSTARRIGAGSSLWRRSNAMPLAGYPRPSTA